MLECPPSGTTPLLQRRFMDGGKHPFENRYFELLRPKIFEMEADGPPNPPLGRLETGGPLLPPV